MPTAVLVDGCWIRPGRNTCEHIANVYRRRDLTFYAEWQQTIADLMLHGF